MCGDSFEDHTKSDEESRKSENRWNGSQVISVPNQRRLERAVESVLAAVEISVDSMAPEVLNLFWMLRKLAEKKYPNSGRRVVGSLLFLRYICPAITNPPKEWIQECIEKRANESTKTLRNLLKRSSSEKLAELSIVARRNLIFVARLLQLIVNEMSGVEGHHQFIADSIPRVQYLFDQVSSKYVETFGMKSSFVNEEVCVQVHALWDFFVQSHQEYLVENLEVPPQNSLEPWLEAEEELLWELKDLHYQQHKIPERKHQHRRSSWNFNSVRSTARRLL